MIEFRTDHIWNVLKGYDQWVCWEADGSSKRPTNPHGYTEEMGPYASTNDRSTWASFERAVRTAEENGWGIGFMFSDDDPFVYIDLDDVLDDDGSVRGWMEGLSMLSGGYIEKSPSGTGLHIIGYGEVPSNPGRKLKTHDISVFDRHQEVRIEDSSRYTTITGDVFGGPAVSDPELDLDSWVESVGDHLARWEEDAATSPTDSGELPSSKTESVTGLSVDDILDEKEYPPGRRRPHPFHDSRTGRDFMVMDGGGLGYCFRHSTELNSTGLLALETGVVATCEQARWLDGEQVSEVCDRARATGYDIPEPESEEKSLGEHYNT